MKKILYLTSIIFCLINTNAYSQNNQIDIIETLSKKIIEKGYGQICSLEMKPVNNNGYYDCLDFPPYRIIFEYQKIEGFVITKKDELFKVMVKENGISNFIVSGPWEQDMPIKIVEFYNNKITNNEESKNNTIKNEQQKKEVTDYINGLSKEKETKKEDENNNSNIKKEDENNQKKETIDNIISKDNK